MLVEDASPFLYYFYCYANNENAVHNPENMLAIVFLPCSY